MNQDEPQQGKVLSFKEALHRRRATKSSATLHAPPGPLFNLYRIPMFVRCLLGVMILVNVPLFLLADEAQVFWIFYHFGFVPGAYTGTLQPAAPLYALLLAPLTHMLLHSGWLHLLVNTVMALAFGTLAEKTWGGRRAALIFLASGLAGVLFFAALNPASTMPLIGASGGLSGWFGASLVFLHAQGRLDHWRGKGPWPMLLFWAGFMTLVAFLSGDMIAWQAHLGGFLTGAILAQRWKIS